MILGILQARYSSTRLPGKVMMPILGKPMLELQLERLLRCNKIDKLVVATSDQDADQHIVDLCIKLNVAVYQGSLDDVLDRFYQAAISHFPSHVVRLTGDCPLADPEIIDEIIDFHVKGNFDYSSNAIQPTFPDGLDVEVMRFSCLEEAWCESFLPSEREHVTPFVNRNPERYKVSHFLREEDLSALRWTVDEPEDFEFVTCIYEALYPNNPYFSTDDVLKYLGSHSELLEINRGIKRNEGAERSLRDDEIFMAARS